MTASIEQVAALIRDVPDFPKEGVLFKDLTPLLGSPGGLRATIELMVNNAPEDIDVVAAVEARGFILGPIAVALGAGFVPLRKPGKLPGEVFRESYQLEYGEATLEMRDDAISPGDRVLLIDDVLATGGTMAAAAQLIRHGGGELVHCQVLLELSELGGRSVIDDAQIPSYNALIVS